MYGSLTDIQRDEMAKAIMPQIRPPQPGAFNQMRPAMRPMANAAQTLTPQTLPPQISPPQKRATSFTDLFTQGRRY